MPSQLRKVLISVLLGLVTPLLTLPLLAYEGGIVAALESPGSRWLLLVTEILFATAIAILKPIVPLVYGLAIAVSFSAIAYRLTSLHPGNLAPLVVFIFTAFGLVVGLAVAVVALPLRRLRLPAWVPLIFAGLAIVLPIATYARNSSRRVGQARGIVARLEEIRQAELAYAASQANHAFTCNGPDLPGLANVEWRADTGLGGSEKNQSRIEGHWIYLECEWSAQPHWFRVRAVPSSKGEEVDIDEQGKISRKPQPAR